MQDHPQPGTIRPGHFLPGSWPFIITLAMLMALLPLSTDMYLPSLPSILLGLQTTPVRVQWTLSALMIGMAAGQVISGPLSDVYGRKPVLMAGLGLFLLAAIMCATAPTIEVLIMGRALAGFAMAGPAVLVRAMVRDLYHGAAAGRELSRMGAVMGLVPGILPVLGGVIEQHWGWRGNFVFAAAWTILFGLIAWRALPETLERRGERWPGILGILKGYPAVMAVGRWWAYALTLMFSHAGLFCFISGSAFVLQKSRGLSPLQFGIAFGITGLAYAAGAFLAQKVVRIQGLDRTIFAGTLALAGAGMAAASARPQRHRACRGAGGADVHLQYRPRPRAAAMSGRRLDAISPQRRGGVIPARHCANDFFCWQRDLLCLLAGRHARCASCWSGAVRPVRLLCISADAHAAPAPPGCGMISRQGVR